MLKPSHEVVGVDARKAIWKAIEAALETCAYQRQRTAIEGIQDGGSTGVTFLTEYGDAVREPDFSFYPDGSLHGCMPSVWFEVADSQKREDVITRCRRCIKDSLGEIQPTPSASEDEVDITQADFTIRSAASPNTVPTGHLGLTLADFLLTDEMTPRQQEQHRSIVIDLPLATIATALTEVEEDRRAAEAEETSRKTHPEPQPRGIKRRRTVFLGVPQAATRP
ncbi:hypothetical protein LTR36_005824 [Oleoguttula mirabilis]|uniref:Uncharacterized protein n=1 Tax=Oleoguttula mirabilis TaxID=1507867 RepID=A0AAV9JD59_9PEZI|nr:hypothetical protein LTR36_005824 [Oleoguttula mirabilis]